MKESLTIRRDPNRAEALDYAQLRQSGLEHIEALSHDLWTDYNAHDPGITLLELLCYAITDLSYRTRLPMADLLAVPADADAETQRRHQALQQHSTLLSALEILPTEPVTTIDLRKLIIDQVPMVRNVWIEQDNSVNYFVDCSRGTQSTIAPPEDHNQTEYRLNGLYRLRVEPHDRITKKLTKQVTTDVAKVFHQHRNLCEDLAGIDLIREQAIRVCADIELTEEADIDLTCARIIHAMQQRLSPPLPRYTLQQLLKKGLAPDEIYSGPQLDHGFLLDEDLQQAELPTQTNAADLIDAIVKTEGVTAVRKLILQSGAAAKTSGDPWNIELESNHRPVFDIEQSALHFFKDLLPYRVDPDEVAKALQQLQQEARQHRATTSDLPAPESRSVAVESYLSIQHELPPAYGVEPTGLPSHATRTRRSQARQLQGFLLLFDQLLANYLTQLRHIGSLFSADPALRHTYFSQVVPGIGEVSELLDPKIHGDYATLLGALDRQSEPDSRRRNQFLDHLLARFGERFTEYALQMQRLRLENNGPRLIQEKARFLQEYALLSRRRGSAFDITERDQIWGSCTNIPGIQHRVGRLLGFRSIRRRNLALLDTDLYEQIDQDSDNDFRFRIKDNLSNKILLSSSTKYKTLEDAVRELRIALDFGRFEESYQPETAKNGSHYFNLVDDKQEIIARRIEYFDTTELRDAALAGTREAINRVYDAEGMHVVENLLLRPRKFRAPADSTLVEDNFISVCPDSDCGTAGEPIDPYSCQIQVLVPAYAPRMHDIDFRHFVERTIRMEMPAHILPRICFVDAEQMANFEEHYRAWLNYRARHPAGEVKSSRHLNRLIAVLQQIHSVYPTGELHDCQEDEGERPILLNRTHLGNEPGN
ncbi:MAG: hypothetical protein JMN27_02690 [gamma proteobacterium endosymbiont of Lamellibrachia anaximandri]|nr:hypothetical protein [gamma proteobacterium endosymbiont of Lamellibrachia anaximandri]MBL3532727.1 hypothetical protein [gamma proteobacterium endosymbiont of Lamellibrachia anaximandri]